LGQYLRNCSTKGRNKPKQRGINKSSQENNGEKAQVMAREATSKDSI
jgi:hypothetical protein